MSHTAECCLLVLFESKDWPAWSAGAVAHDESARRNANRDAAWLRQELASTKQYLQSIVDEQEAASQELRAAHEEVLSSNEELQSTNEELETTKEELQSANEELTTVNEQFLTRNRELDALTDDLSNFISSADLPMVTVGRDLRIRRLTPAAQRAFNLLPTDVGRSLEHIKFSLAVDDIGGIIDQVISSVQPWEREVRDRDGRWWLLRVLPFRTADNRIDGATIVAVDIDLIRRSHELIEARDYALAIVQAVREPLVVLDADCRVGMANDAFYALVGETADQIEGKHLWDTAAASGATPQLRQTLKDACAGKHAARRPRDRAVRPGPHPARWSSIRRLDRAQRAAGHSCSWPSKTSPTRARPRRCASTPKRCACSTSARTSSSASWRTSCGTRWRRCASRSNCCGAPTASRPRSRGRGRCSTARSPTWSGSSTICSTCRGSRRAKSSCARSGSSWRTLVNAAVELCRPAIDAARHTLDRLAARRGGHARCRSGPADAGPGEPAEQRGQVHAAGRSHLADRRNDGRARRSRTRSGSASATPASGSPEELLPKIFDMFMQGDVSLERTRAGLGVGLTLVRIWWRCTAARSTPAATARARAASSPSRLPIDPQAQPARQPTTPAPTPPARPLRILVADDNDDGREMLGYLLTAEGHTVALARDGPAAIETAASFHPDVAILDIGMPGMNGYAVARTLRQQPRGARARAGRARPGWASRKTRPARRRPASIAISPSRWTSTTSAPISRRWQARIP